MNIEYDAIMLLALSLQMMIVTGYEYKGRHRMALNMMRPTAAIWVAKFFTALVSVL